MFVSREKEQSTLRNCAKMNWGCVRRRMVPMGGITVDYGAMSGN